MTEPAVTLTDYALAIECAVFCVLLARGQALDIAMQRWWIVFFAAIGAASLLGGTVHGFFNAPGSQVRSFLWPATLLSIAVATLAVWVIAARLLLRPDTAMWVKRAAVAQWLALLAVVLLVSQRFVVVIIAYVPATAFLLVALIFAQRRKPELALNHGIAGIALTFVAAAVQQLRISVHPVYLDHNALYHLIQGFALFLLFLGSRRLMHAWRPSPATT